MVIVYDETSSTIGNFSMQPFVLVYDENASVMPNSILSVAIFNKI